MAFGLDVSSGFVSLGSVCGLRLWALSVDSVCGLRLWAPVWAPSVKIVTIRIELRKRLGLGLWLDF